MAMERRLETWDDIGVYGISIYPFPERGDGYDFSTDYWNHIEEGYKVKVTESVDGYPSQIYEGREYMERWRRRDTLISRISLGGKS